MKYTIGIFGSAVEESPVCMEKCRQLGEVLAMYSSDVILCSGACPGVPYKVLRSAWEKGKGEIVGYASEVSEEALCSSGYGGDLSTYTKIWYVPKTFPLADSEGARKKYRNVLSTAASDAGIIVSGRWGTMNEFTSLHDMGKVIGVLTGTGGIADELESWSKKITKPSEAIIFYESDPEILVKNVIAELEKRRKS